MNEKNSNFHPIDLMGHDVIAKLRKLGAGYQVEYYVLETAWKIYDEARRRMRLESIGISAFVFFLGFCIGAVIFNGLCR